MEIFGRFLRFFPGLEVMTWMRRGKRVSCKFDDAKWKNVVTITHEKHWKSLCLLAHTIKMVDFPASYVSFPNYKYISWIRIPAIFFDVISGFHVVFQPTKNNKETLVPRDLPWIHWSCVGSSELHFQVWFRKPEQHPVKRAASKMSKRWWRNWGFTWPNRVLSI